MNVKVSPLNVISSHLEAIIYYLTSLKRNSCQKATKALFGIEYESNLSVKHNYDERGTFKIYRNFSFGHVNFEQEC